jgi:hypothetical protein
MPVHALGSLFRASFAGKMPNYFVCRDRATDEILRSAFYRRGIYASRAESGKIEIGIKVFWTKASMARILLMQSSKKKMDADKLELRCNN